MPIPSFEEIEPVAEPSGFPMPSFEEIPADEPMRIGATPEKELSFGGKWKEYFFPTPEEARWTEPTRPEKFYNVTKAPAVTGLKMLGSVMTRMNKFFAEVSPIPEVLHTTATLDPKYLKDIFPSIWKARKVFNPVPGGADELKTWGESMAEDWYVPVAGKEPPWWYTPAMDVAFETLLLSGAAAQRASRARNMSFSDAKLSSVEIKAAKRIFATKKLAQMAPSKVRATLARESATIALNKADKYQLLRRGYKPRQIQNMTPLDAFQLLDDVPIVQSAAEQNLASATKVAVDRLTAGIKRAGKLQPQKARQISMEKARRVAVGEALRRQKTGEAAFYAARGAMKGEYPVPAFTAPEISSADRYYMFQSLRNSRLSFFKYQDTGNALRKVLQGELPGPKEIALLKRHFGGGLAKALLDKRTAGQKALAFALDAINVPRATLASIDLSFPLRQGIILLPGHPKAWMKSFGQMMHTAIPGRKGKEYARYLEDMADNSRYAALRNRAKLEITEWGLTDISMREEAFMSTIAERLPGVKWSERTFTTMSNQLRINVFDDVARNWEKAGMSWQTHPEEYQRLAAFLNHATGRGTVPTRYATLTAEMNALFFSPRFQLSRPQLVYDAFVSLKNPAARKVIIGDLVKYVSSGVVGMVLLNQIDGVEVEDDPRSSDFGKIQVGNTRYDYWGGYSQIARLVVQTALAQQKATGTEEIYPINRAEVIERYVRTKLSPPAGGAWDTLTGTTLTGDEMSLDPAFLLKDVLWDRIAPMVIQDIVDAIRFQGVDGVLPITSTTAFFGVSVGTWEPSKWSLLTNAENELAMSTYGKEWDALNEVEQELLTQDNELLANLRREAAYDQTVFPFLEEIKRDQMAAGLEIEDLLPEPVQKEMERLKVRIGLLPRTFGKWTLNDQRYAQYKNYILKGLEENLSSLITSSEWKDESKEGQTFLIERTIENARKSARLRVRVEALAE